MDENIRVVEKKCGQGLCAEREEDHLQEVEIEVSSVKDSKAKFEQDQEQATAVLEDIDRDNEYWREGVTLNSRRLAQGYGAEKGQDRPPSLQ